MLFRNTSKVEITVSVTDVKMSAEQRWEWHWMGKAELLGEKPLPLPYLPPQIPHEMSCDWTRYPRYETSIFTFS